MKTSSKWIIVCGLMLLAVVGLHARATGEASSDGSMSAAGTEVENPGTIIAYNTPAEYEQQTGNTIAEFSEAPALAALVESGDLPAVRDRLPVEPIVIKPLDSVGKYGGEIRASSLGPARGYDSNSVRSQRLFKFSYDLATVEPNIALGWDLADDLQSITIHLREGLRWSDGEPFTTEDVIFWYEDIIANEDLTPVKPSALRPGGNLMTVSRIDDYTFRADFDGPYPAIATVIALGDGGLWFAPKHYLSQYHIKYNESAEELAKEEGYDNWTLAFSFHAQTGLENADPERPELISWVLSEVTTSQKVYDRNPYFWKVDVAGNQLPYADREVEVYYSDTEVLNVAVMSGEVSFANQDLTLSNYPLYRRSQESGDYRTVLMQQPVGSNLGFGFNPTHKDPVLRELFNDLRFKQAMSVAIDRDVINENFFFGEGTARQGVLPSSDTLYEEWMDSYYTQYDPDLANELLDEIGLEWNDQHTQRLRPDGEPLTFTLHATPVGVAPAEPIIELISEFLADVGVVTDIQVLERSLFLQRGRANEHDVAFFQFGGNGNEIRMLTTGGTLYRPPWGVLNIGYPWYLWVNTNGEQGEEPPEIIKELFDTIDKWTMTVPGSPEYMEYGHEILRIHVENLYYLGTVGEVPSPATFKNGLKNTPKEGGIWLVTYNFASPHVPEQWYWE